MMPKSLVLVLLAAAAQAQSPTPTVVAGGGPDNLAATNANIGEPTGVAVDATGNLFLASDTQARIYRVSPGGQLTFFAKLPATFDGRDFVTGTPSLALDGRGNLFVLQHGGTVQRRRLDRFNLATAASTQISTTPDGGALAADPAGNIYFYDTAGLRKLDTNSQLTTIIPAANTAALNRFVLAVEPAGTLLGSNGFQFVRINAATGAFATLPGLSSNAVAALSVDSAGNIYTAAGNVVRRIAPDGTIVILAGTGGSGFSGDNGPAVQAQLNQPRALALDSARNLFVADAGNLRVRRVDNAASPIIRTVAGNGFESFGGDGAPGPSASLSGPNGAVFDSSGNLFILDAGNNRIRRVAPGGIITTALQTGLNRPTALSIDNTGTLYFTNAGDNSIRRLRPGQTSSELVASGANVSEPQGVAVDRKGNLFFSDNQNRVRRIVLATGSNTVVAGNGTFATSGDGGPATQAAIRGAGHLALDSEDNLYIAQTGSSGVRVVTIADGKISTVLSPILATGIAVDIADFLYVSGGGILTRFKAPSGNRPGLQQSVAQASGRGLGLLGEKAAFCVGSTVVTVPIPKPQISVTLNTVPTGLSVIVDGQTLRAPATFAADVNSSHTIATINEQFGAASTTRFLFQGWSDNGALSHTITANLNTTSFTADFKRQFQFLRQALPADQGRIAITPLVLNSFADPGVYTLIPLPNEGFRFVSFTGDLNSTQTPATFQLSAPATVTANFAPINGFLPQRLNSGGAAFTDSLGQQWQGDAAAGKSGLTIFTTAPIAGTADQKLYQDARVGPNTFTFTVPPSNSYNVRLKFAEIAPTIAAAQRVFNVRINGQNVLTNFDIFQEANRSNQALDKLFSITAPASGQIAIELVALPGKADPIVSAIQIVANVVGVTVSPASEQVEPGRIVTFVPTVAGSPDTSVRWSIEPAIGTISPAGVYTAPSAIAERRTVTVTATSNADPTRTATAILTLIPGWQSTDIGSPSAPGSYSYEAGIHTLAASDAPRFASQPLSGDGAIVARVHSSGQGTAGLMIRAGVAADAPSVFLPATAAPWLRLVRLGSTILRFTSLDGIQWTQEGEPVAVALPLAAMAGLAVNTGSASFDSVSFAGPIAVSIDQRPASLAPGQQTRFTATLTGTDDARVVWSLSPNLGTLSEDGFYVAPDQPGTVTVTAASAADPGANSTTTISIGEFTPIRINAGGPDAGDWQADAAYIGGSAVRLDAETGSPEFLSSARVGEQPFRYRFVVPPGTYLARLYFPAPSLEASRFHIDINGARVATGIDGAEGELQFSVDAARGAIEIVLTPESGSASLAALEIANPF